MIVALHTSCRNTEQPYVLSLGKYREVFSIVNSGLRIDCDTKMAVSLSHSNTAFHASARIHDARQTRPNRRGGGTRLPYGILLSLATFVL